MSLYLEDQLSFWNRLARTSSLTWLPASSAPGWPKAPSPSPCSPAPSWHSSKEGWRTPKVLTHGEQARQLSWIFWTTPPSVVTLMWVSRSTRMTSCFLHPIYCRSLFLDWMDYPYLKSSILNYIGKDPEFIFQMWTLKQVSSAYLNLYLYIYIYNKKNLTEILVHKS